jgi:PAS domain-containing protein
VKPLPPLPLNHSWPIFGYDGRLNLGSLFNLQALNGHCFESLDDELLAAHGIGRWECDLRDESLIWTDSVFDLFALPRTARPSRAETVALYREESRAAMERLRAHAIRHRRGFTLDTQIRTARGDSRWMRLLAAPVCADGRVVRLQGLKQNVSHYYR